MHMCSDVETLQITFLNLLSVHQCHIAIKKGPHIGEDIND